eukprot:3540045-Pleurochrysis_carterae.AAC.1
MQMLAATMLRCATTHNVKEQRRAKAAGCVRQSDSLRSFLHGGRAKYRKRMARVPLTQRQEGITKL